MLWEYRTLSRGFKWLETAETGSSSAATSTSQLELELTGCSSIAMHCGPHAQVLKRPTSPSSFSFVLFNALDSFIMRSLNHAWIVIWVAPCEILKMLVFASSSCSNYLFLPVFRNRLFSRARGRASAACKWTPHWLGVQDASHPPCRK